MGTFQHVGRLPPKGGLDFARHLSPTGLSVLPKSPQAKKHAGVVLRGLFLCVCFCFTSEVSKQANKQVNCGFGRDGTCLTPCYQDFAMVASGLPKATLPKAAKFLGPCRQHGCKDLCRHASSPMPSAPGFPPPPPGMMDTWGLFCNLLQLNKSQTHRATY